MKKVTLLMVLILVMSLTASFALAKEGSLEWHGQANFTITLPSGKKIVIDPFNKAIGYDLPTLYADIVLVTHEHADHNYVKFIEGNPELLRGLSEDGKEYNKINYDKDGVLIFNVFSYHDKKEGAERGKNSIFVIQASGKSIVHLGDLGQILTDKQVDEIGAVDILLIPVGGHFTIDANDADEVIKKLNPKIVIPMHYKTDRITTLPIVANEDFLKGKEYVKAGSNKFVLDFDEILSGLKYVVLDYQ